MIESWIGSSNSWDYLLPEKSLKYTQRRIFLEILADEFVELHTDYNLLAVCAI